MPTAAVVVPVLVVLILTAAAFFVRYRRRGAASVKSMIAKSRATKVSSLYEDPESSDTYQLTP